VADLHDRTATAELRALETVQGAIARPPVVRVARAMSLFGEHAGGWLALGALGALADRRRRRDWVTATAAVALAHGASIGVKRVVRRPRPDHPQVQVLAGTPSRLSFPSAHASTSFAGARALAAAGLPAPPLRAVAAAMALSRPYLGVHYPTDVLAGALLGDAVARLMTR